MELKLTRRSERAGEDHGRRRGRASPNRTREAGVGPREPLMNETDDQRSARRIDNRVLSAPPHLPAWAAEMRDLFRSGSAAQFLLHGNVFDVVPHGGKLLSLPAFLDAGDVRQLRRRAALRPQPRRARDARRRGLGRLAAERARPRGVDADADARAGLGARADRSLPAAHAQPAGAARRRRRQAQADRRHHRVRRVRRAARRRAAARRPVRRQHRQGPRLGQRPGDRPVEHRHRADQRGPARSQRARRREPARRGAAPAAAERSGHARLPDRRSSATQFPDLAAKCDVPIETLARG